MPKLILIKHSLPTIDPSLPANRWQLAPEGEERSSRLAAMLTGYLPAVLVSSPEPKAIATAAILAEHLELTNTTVDGLEEHHRVSAPFSSSAAFQQTMHSFFEHPSDLVFGEESADAAFTRFARTLDALFQQHSQHNLLVVTHGTVMSLYLGRRISIDAWTIWQQLGLPSFVVVDRATLAIEKVESEIV